MTLAPIENRNVRGVPAERYPLNTQCSNPECDNATDDPHHIFRRSAIGNDSYFVEIEYSETPTPEVPSGTRVEVMPHVTGLCRECHEKVTDHRYWIKLEGDVFVLYERVVNAPWDGMGEDDERRWRNVGPLDPQPGGREKSRKAKRKRKQGDERRKRKTISLRVPDDTEDGGAIWDETLERVKAKLVVMGLYSEGDKIPNYEAGIAAWQDWLDA